MKSKSQDPETSFERFKAINVFRNEVEKENKTNEIEKLLAIVKKVNQDKNQANLKKN